MQIPSRKSKAKKSKIVKCNIPDSRLLLLLQEDNYFAWNCIYDKYAALMYGNILNITKNKKMAETLFVNAFKNLREQNKPLPLECSMSNFLCMYAKKYAINTVPTV